MLQLHMSDQQVYCQLRCNLYQRFGGMSLRWRHNGNDGVSNHQPRHCLLKRLFRRRSKKTSKLRVTGLCAGNSPGTGEFPAQIASNAENVSIWWRHHEATWDCQHNHSNVNLLLAKFFIENMKIYLQFVLFLYNDIMQIVEMLSYVRK